MIRVILLTLAFTATRCEETAAGITATGQHVELEVTTEEMSTVEDLTNLGTPDGRNATNDISDLPEMRSRRTEGGFRAIIQQFPYVVALYDIMGVYTCVGTIIAPKLILTANHCIRLEFGNKLTSIRARSSDNLYGGVKMFIQKIIAYPGANENGDPRPHDIALIVPKERLDSPTVTLADANTPILEFGTVQTVGWGRKSTGETRHLWTALLLVYPINKCKKEYEGDNWICTDTRKTSTCEGDSGGPILLDGKQVGIVSFSKDTKYCGSGVPTANVNLKKYLSWIHKYTEDTQYQ